MQQISTAESQQTAPAASGAKNETVTCSAGRVSGQDTRLLFNAKWLHQLPPRTRFRQAHPAFTEEPARLETIKNYSYQPRMRQRLFLEIPYFHPR